MKIRIFTQTFAMAVVLALAGGRFALAAKENATPQKRTPKAKCKPTIFLSLFIILHLWLHLWLLLTVQFPAKSRRQNSRESSPQPSKEWHCILDTASNVGKSKTARSPLLDRLVNFSAAGSGVRLPWFCSRGSREPASLRPARVVSARGRMRKS